ncbi:hypothetical protein MHI48_16920 [Paenibacillus sp. FSL H7-0942]|uniref:hypothetical protein n=1 Tax=Paenibacillus TaxID=44249 RepID=UPI00096D0BD2|nr:hypothetical protein [Paenibacillus amylolyticus]OMF05707.1 hypothetical protein BK129_17285 [Paenibacillus amylolyticus]
MGNLDLLFNCKVSKYEECMESMFKSFNQVKKSYSYLDNSFYKELVTIELLQNKGNFTNYVYWTELLQRVHMCSSISLIRNYKWLQGVSIAVDNNNFLAFAAALRGLLVAAGDSYHSLHTISKTLADNYKMIRLAVQKRLPDQIFVSEDLENALLHFSEAKKWGEFEAKNDSEYISIKAMLKNKSLQRKITNCYKDLCELTHPASITIYSFLQDSKYDSNIKMLEINSDERNIVEFCSKYKDIFIDVLYAGFNPALINLQTLNQFPYHKTQTNFNISLDNIKLWVDIKNGINETVTKMKAEKEFY